MIIYGIHPVLSFIKYKPGSIKKIYIEHGLINKYYQLLNSFQGEIIKTTNEFIEKVSMVRENQGIAAELTCFPYVNFMDYVSRIEYVCVLDHIEDPRNLGAIIRNALAFRIGLVIIPKHRACDVTASAIKASAGTAAILPIANVTNINQTIRFLKDNDYWIYGLESSGNTKLSKTSFSHKSVLVLGSEGKGLSQLTRKLCDFLVEIESDSAVSSLNVSSASAIAFYSLSRSLNVA